MELEAGGQVSFKKLLLNRCQEEFLRDKKDESQFDALRREIESASEVQQSSPSFP